MIAPENLFHVGFVVADLGRAQAELEALGHTFAPTMDAPVQVLTPEGAPVQAQATLTYSLQEPRIELIQALDGTPWPTSAVGAIHHLGYWVDALAPAMEQADAEGWTRQWHGRDDEGRPARFAYYLMAHNDVRVEFVDRSVIGASLERWWAGDAYRGAARD